MIDNAQDSIERSFAFVTTVGLYDANEELLAVAKLSRPVEKNVEKGLNHLMLLNMKKQKLLTHTVISNEHLLLILIKNFLISSDHIDPILVTF